jgi:2-succinyl-6-hydroxy-2,4-cyclohexadiene-1-carboxylate synthase
MGRETLKRAFTRVNDVNIFYRNTVVGADTILCLHGRWGRGETWTDLLRRYRDRYRIVAPDQRGHGLSDRPQTTYSGADLAQDMYELIVKLDCAPAIVIGHSMGGRVAGTLAALYPDAVKALAILDEPAAEPDIEYVTSEDGTPIDTLTADWPTPYPTYQDALDHLGKKFERESNVRYFLDSLVETTEGYDFLFSRYAMGALSRDYRDWDGLLDKIKCPVLLVRAMESWCLSEEEADKIRMAMRGCSYYEVSNSDHMVYADNPDEFYPGLDRFLESIPG